MFHHRIAVSAVGAALFTLALASTVQADHGPASDQASCVGEFASTGGTQEGRGFGELISGTARAQPGFGSAIVREEARAEQGACPFDPDVFFPPE